MSAGEPLTRMLFIYASEKQAVAAGFSAWSSRHPIDLRLHWVSLSVMLSVRGVEFSHVVVDSSCNPLTANQRDQLRIVRAALRLQPMLWIEP